MKKQAKYKEILVLAALMTKKGIRYEIEQYMDGYHIGYPELDSPEISIIEHFASYGNELDLLEFMRNGNVYPRQTAHQVLKEIIKIEKSRR